MQLSFALAGRFELRAARQAGAAPVAHRSGCGSRASASCSRARVRDVSRQQEIAARAQTNGKVDPGFVTAKPRGFARGRPLVAEP